MVSEQQNKSLVTRYFQEVWDQGNLEAVDGLLAADFVRHGPPPTEGDIAGGSGFKGLVTMYRTAYPDLRVPIEDQFAEGNTVVTRWTARGTHRGDLMGTPPTGKPVAVPGIVIDRIEGGRIAEEWASYDALGMLQQVGVIPAA
jgi:steroid delta-isomerase-like uncharacterized protein